MKGRGAHTGLIPLSLLTQDHQPRGGTTHNGLVPPPSVTDEEKLDLVEVFP